MVGERIWKDDADAVAATKAARQQRDNAETRRLRAAPDQRSRRDGRTGNPWLDIDSNKSWPDLHPAALYGLAGDVVKTIAPETEADPAALLVQYLAAAGNMIGRGPFYRVEADRHGANLFVVIVGQTSKSRKGTSWGRVAQVMRIADPEWMRERVHTGMSSGEGVDVAGA